MTNEAQYQRLCAAYTELIGSPAPEMTRDILVCLQYAYGSPFPVGADTCNFLRQLASDPTMIQDWKAAAVNSAECIVLDSLMERQEVSDEDIQQVRRILQKGAQVSRDTVNATMRNMYGGLIDGTLRKSGADNEYTQRMQKEFFEMYQQVHGTLPTPERVTAYVGKFPPTAQGYVDFQRGLSADLAFV